MAKIVESLKRLSVEKTNSVAKSKAEFVASVEEAVSHEEENYVLGICGTQRYTYYAFLHLMLFDDRLLTDWCVLGFVRSLS